MVAVPLGLSVTAAILLHEIPQEIGDFGVLVHAGYSVKKALALNLVTATSALAGAVLTYFFLGAWPRLQGVLLALTAGGFLYIALADLIPQLHEETDTRQTLTQIALLALGFGMMILLKES